MEIFLVPNLNFYDSTISFVLYVNDIIKVNINNKLVIKNTKSIDKNIIMWIYLFF